MSKISSKVKIVDKDDLDINPASEASQLSVLDILNNILEMAQNLRILGSVKGTLADLRVTLTGGSITSITTVTNQAQVGAYLANPQIPALTNTVAVESNIKNIVIS